jgi:Ni,Fe-hydrogenase III large subunit
MERIHASTFGISPQEAMRVADKLGGEIGVEKSLTFSNALEKRKKST